MRPYTKDAVTQPCSCNENPRAPVATNIYVTRFVAYDRMNNTAGVRTRTVRV